MRIRPRSAASDLDLEVHATLDDALSAGLTPDQIQSITQDVLNYWLKDISDQFSEDGQTNPNRKADR